MNENNKINPKTCALSVLSTGETYIFDVEKLCLGTSALF